MEKKTVSSDAVHNRAGMMTIVANWMRNQAGATSIEQN